MIGFSYRPTGSPEEVAADAFYGNGSWQAAATAFRELYFESKNTASDCNNSISRSREEHDREVTEFCAGFRSTCRGQNGTGAWSRDLHACEEGARALIAGPAIATAAGGNTLSCRRYHLEIAAEGPAMQTIHCAHASQKSEDIITGADKCTAPPSAADFCNQFVATCGGSQTDWSTRSYLALARTHAHYRTSVLVLSPRHSGRCGFFEGTKSPHAPATFCTQLCVRLSLIQRRHIFKSMLSTHIPILVRMCNDAPPFFVFSARGWASIPICERGFRAIRAPGFIGAMSGNSKACRISQLQKAIAAVARARAGVSSDDNGTKGATSVTGTDPLDFSEAANACDAAGPDPTASCITTVDEDLSDVTAEQFCDTYAVTCSGVPQVKSGWIFRDKCVAAVRANGFSDSSCTTELLIAYQAAVRGILRRSRLFSCCVWFHLKPIRPSS